MTKCFHGNINIFHSTINIYQKFNLFLVTFLAPQPEPPARQIQRDQTFEASVGTTNNEESGKRKKCHSAPLLFRKVQRTLSQSGSGALVTDSG